MTLPRKIAIFNNPLLFLVTLPVILTQSFAALLTDVTILSYPFLTSNNLSPFFVISNFCLSARLQTTNNFPLPSPQQCQTPEDF
jgi:hypothetical protein